MVWNTNTSDKVVIRVLKSGSIYEETYPSTMTVKLAVIDAAKKHSIKTFIVEDEEENEIDEEDGDNALSEYDYLTVIPEAVGA